MSNDNPLDRIFGSTEENLKYLVQRGPAVHTFWAMNLSMGFHLYKNKEVVVFRYPSVPAHPDCKDPVCVTDDEFRKFIHTIRLLR